MSIVATILAILLALVQTPLTKTESITWEQIAVTPDTLGLAGVFSGFVDGTMIVAGGANFPDGPPSRGGTKRWSSDMYVLRNGEWTVYTGVLPSPLAYGASVPLAHGLLCIGGDNAEGTSDKVFLLKTDGAYEEWPPLPQPLSHMAFARLGNRIYLAGGETHGSAVDIFLCLDLSTGKKWRQLKALPGGPRAFAAGVIQSDGQDNCFYMFGGREYSPGSEWTVHTDAWAYNPRFDKWKPVSGRFDTMAGTAQPFGTNHILLIGGSAPPTSASTVCDCSTRSREP